MLRKLKIVFTTILLSATCAIAQTGRGTIKGTVKDKNSGEEMPFVKVVVYQGESQKGYATTSFDGGYIIPSLEPGEYTVEVKFIGYNSIKEEGVLVSSDRYVIRNYELTPSSEMLDVVEVITYEVPLIDKDGGASGQTVTREDISKMAARSATGVAQTVGGVYSAEGSDDLNIRGSRSEDSYYFIDGIKVRGSTALPKSALQEVSVITGGLPASYGDITGGVISITTRGPSSRYFGSAEYVTSGFYLNGQDPLGYDGRVFGMDKYAYNLFEGMISGPLLMKKDSTGEKTKPILGFFLSANFTDVLDNRPLHNGGAYRIKQGVRDSLLDPALLGPLRPSGGATGSYYNTFYLNQNDFEQVPWRMNARSQAISASGKIDVNVGSNMNLTFGGTLAYSNGTGYSYANSLMNFENFGVNTNFDWRVYGKFTQRFNNNVEGSDSKIKSAYYSLMVDYTQSHNKSWDDRHRDNVFNYGYVGRFTTSRIPTYEFSNAGDSLIHNGFRDTEVVFEPSTENQAFAAVTSQYYDIYAGQLEGNYENLFQIQDGGGLRNGDTPPSVYGIWNNIGTPYNFYGFGQRDQLRVTGSGTINLSNHAISLGFEYEQRWDRNFQADDRFNGPIGLWQIARQYMNSHIQELDKSDVTFDYFGTFPRVTYGRLNSSPGEYGGAENNDNQYFFDYNVRNALGLNPDGTDFVDIDQYDPDFFSLSMFSADELQNQGNAYFRWYGYDHTGQKVKGNTDINKYFSEYDEFGNFKRHIGAFQPIYMAGYIMDKFAFDDIIFNVGLRLDVFDANQPVLKDRYLVYEAKTVQEVTAFDNGTPITHPENMGNDYVVYINDVDNITTINGYRSGDTWYDASGVEVADPKVIEGPKGIAPWLQDPSLQTPNADAFQDYKPQVNLMPRVAFSFPISDEAAFFAHYDVLTKRPTTGNIFDPTNYQFIQTRNILISNPDLLPERTIDYEIGFQQVLTKTSSIKVSAFYKEQRDQVQVMMIPGAYPVNYRTFGNRDFGTIKGTTIFYDMRRTGNLRMTASYTLSFANGTGSDATSALNLVNSGQPNLRNIFPYAYDQRHNFNAVIDYRYGGGKDYKGPKIKNFGVFENTGLNITANLGSGTPYSRQIIATAQSLVNPVTSGLEGTLNGSRKPWTYRVDFQLDRNFDMSFGKDENKKKAAYLNVYLRVTNLFNIVNVLNVYRFTGNPDDDGFLLSAQGQNVTQNQLSPSSYFDYYSLKTNNPFNYGIPRTVRLGVMFNF